MRWQMNIKRFKSFRKYQWDSRKISLINHKISNDPNYFFAYNIGGLRPPCEMVIDINPSYTLYSIYYEWLEKHGVVSYLVNWD